MLDIFVRLLRKKMVQATEISLILYAPACQIVWWKKYYYTNRSTQPAEYFRTKNCNRKRKQCYNQRIFVNGTALKKIGMIGPDKRFSKFVKSSNNQNSHICVSRTTIDVSRFDPYLSWMFITTVYTRTFRRNSKLDSREKEFPIILWLVYFK